MLPRLARPSAVGQAGSGLHGAVAHQLAAADAAAAADDEDDHDDDGSVPAPGRNNAAPEHGCTSHAVLRSPAT